MLPFLSVLSHRRAWVIGVLLAVVLLAGGAFWYVRSTAAGADSADDANGVNILLGLADSAMHDGRLVAPQGSNAYEFYFSVLQLEPHNEVALDNLKKAFVPACKEVERLINPNDLDEAQRELSLRVLVTRQHEAQAALIQAQQDAAGTH